MAPCTDPGISFNHDEISMLKYLRNHYIIMGVAPLNDSGLRAILDTCFVPFYITKENILTQK